MFTIRLYQRALARRPFLTQTISAGVLAATSDAISQIVVERRRLKDNYDWTRTVRFAGIMSCLMAPSLYHWFQFLERFRGNFYLLKRVITDQVFGAPVFTITILGGLKLLEGQPMNIETLVELRQKFWSILATNYKVWPLVQLFNFYMIPLQYRIIFGQTVGIFWNAYLSYMTQSTTSTALQKL